jgi:hypothetical protein
VPHIHAHPFNDLLPPERRPPPDTHVAAAASSPASHATAAGPWTRVAASPPAPHAAVAGPWARAAASPPAPHTVAATPWTRAARSNGRLPLDHIAAAEPWIEAVTRLRIEGSLNFKWCEQQSPSAVLQVETKISITSPCLSPRTATVPMSMPMLREHLRTCMVHQCERHAREPEA